MVHKTIAMSLLAGTMDLSIVAHHRAERQYFAHGNALPFLMWRRNRL